MNNFINDYFKNEDIFYIFLLNRNKEPHTTKQYYCNKKQFKKFEELNYIKWNKLGVDIYFSLNTFEKVDNKISRKKENVKNVKTLFFDIDENGEEIKNQIIEKLGLPSYIFQTSKNKFQLLYLLKNENIDFMEFEKISKTLTKYFNTDHTFDISRVSRLPNFINNKNGFEVNFIKNNVDYDLKYFKDFIKNNNIELLTFSKENGTHKEKRKKIVVKNVKQNLKNIDIKYKNNKKMYVDIYQNFLIKNGNDRSKSDFDFVVYLKKNRKLKKETTIKKWLLFVSQKFQNLQNQEKYFNDIFNKVN